MSLKPGNKNPKKKEISQAHILWLQKETLSSSTFKHFMGTLFLAILLIYVLHLTIIEHEGIWSTFFMLLIFMLVFVDFIRRYLILRRLNIINASSDYEITVQCKDVRFLLDPIGGTSGIILCVILRDQTGTPYYYIYPSEDAPFDNYRTLIKNKFTEKTVKLKCYQDTNFIKTLPL